MKIFKRIYIMYYKKMLVLLCYINHKWATKFLFNHNMEYKLNLKHPKTFNEKIQWLKLNKFDELVTKCADKIEVRKYVEEKGFSNILPKLICTYLTANEINYDLLPNKYALKCNHGAGYNIIVTDARNNNKENCNKKLSKWLNEDYWTMAAEFQYKYIQKKIICEEFIEEFENKPPLDYKIHCFNGEPKIILVCSDRDGINHPKYAYYDMNWKKKSYSQMYMKNDITYEKPQHFDEMIHIAQVLSKPFDFVRVDLYDTDKKVYFGELTFTPAGGIDNDLPYDADVEMGKMLDLRDI